MILDSQSVPTSIMVHEAVGYDAHQATKGGKGHTVVEPLGRLMCVAVTAASVPEGEGGKKVRQRLRQLGQQVRRLDLVWVDGGDDGQPFLEWVMDTYRWIVEVVKRPEASKGFTVLKKRR